MHLKDYKYSCTFIITFQVLMRHGLLSFQTRNKVKEVDTFRYTSIYNNIKVSQ